MEIKFSEFDIRDLLSKVTLFEPTIGSYQFFTVNEQFLYIVKLSNGTIYFTIDELLANREQRISREQLTLVAGRFTKAASPSGPQRRRESVIPDEYADVLGTSGPKNNRSRMVILGVAVVMGLGMVGAMVFLMSAPETDVPVYIEEPIELVDTSGNKKDQPRPEMEKPVEKDSNSL